MSASPTPPSPQVMRRVEPGLEGLRACVAVLKEKEEEQKVAARGGVFPRMGGDLEGGGAHSSEHEGGGGYPVSGGSGGHRDQLISIL